MAVERIYLDYNATSPPRPEALAAMTRALRDGFGNPSSLHWAGRRATRALEQAREHVADLIHAPSGELLFTSGGTESNNLALRGVLLASGPATKHVITTAIEHSSVLEPLRALVAARCCTLTVLPVDQEGRLSPSQLQAAVQPDTRLVSIGMANTEIGTLQRIPELSAVAGAHNIPLHVDAVQALGKVPVDVQTLGADLVSLSAHKIAGPQGCGALYLRKGTPFLPVQRGGPQEREKRAGTQNVAAAVGFGIAAYHAGRELEQHAVHCHALTSQLWQGIHNDISHVACYSPRERRLPNTLSVGFAGASGEGLMLALDLAGVAVSTGSACAAGSLEPSHVLLALGFDGHTASGALRFSVGRETSEQEVARVLAVLPPIVERVRQAARTD